jgi:peptide/nickel transport system permease protein
MSQYVIRRILQAIPLLILIAVLVFILLKTAGDPLAYLAEDPTVSETDRIVLRSRLGLDDPLPLQFVHWLIGDDWYVREIVLPRTGEVLQEPGQRRGVLRGDMGNSLHYRKPVVEVIGDFLPNTLILGGTAYIVIIVAAFSIGIFAALRQYTMADNIITAGAFITYSMPIFLIALLAIYVFAVLFRQWGLPYLPVQGMYSVRGDRSIFDLMWHLVLPVTSLAAIQIAGYSRYIRSTMLEVINSDYIRTARAKGLSERRVTYLHALKNASLPLVTLMGLDIPFILSGAVVTETIFSWPGMGRLFITSLERLDYAVLIIFVLMIAVAVVIFQLLTDILYALLDPRVRYS